MMMNRFTLSPKVSFRLKAHDAISLEVFLRYLFELFTDLARIDLAKIDRDAKDFGWVVNMREYLAELCAYRNDTDEVRFWKSFRNVTGGFRGLEGALNDRQSDFEARVSFEPPAFHRFKVVLRDRRTDRYLEAVVRPKDEETIDLRCCVNTEPVDTLDLLREKAESLQGDSANLGPLTVVEILELVNGCVQGGGLV